MAGLMQGQRALADVVKGAGRTSQRVTWVRADGNPQNLTGASLSGRMRRVFSDEWRECESTFIVADAAAGVFDWHYAQGDIETPGVHILQVKATYHDGTDSTLAAAFGVRE